MEKLIGKKYHEIKTDDTGGNSRAYIIDGGKIVFKFPRNDQVTYDNEIKILQTINGIRTGVNLQKVGWLSNDNKYIGLLGVTGKSISCGQLKSEQKRQIGEKIGIFLKELHKIKTDCVPNLALSEEINAWQKRYLGYKDIITPHLDTNMRDKLNKLMLEDMPKELNKLGEDMVFCHGDLGDSNIFINEEKVGIIDFNESGYFDRAADFMDIRDDEILSHMLDSYEADDILRKKVQIRRTIRPVIALRCYILKEDESEIKNTINQIMGVIGNNVLVF